MYKTIGKEAKSITQLHFLILSLIFITLLPSCVSWSELRNFRNDDEVEPLVWQTMNIDNKIELEIQPDDILSIQVYTVDMVASAPFNLTSSEDGGNQSKSGYLVNADGYIDFPVIGQLKLSGLTIEAAKNLLLERLMPFLNSPIVNIRFVNFKITILGEVKSPSTLVIEDESINILEALGRVGDVTEYGRRDNVLIIREKDNERTFGYINLQSQDIFQSPYFYLAQNDVIYVEPAKFKTARVTDPAAKVLPWVSGITIVLTLLINLTR